MLPIATQKFETSDGKFFDNENDALVYQQKLDAGAELEKLVDGIYFDEQETIRFFIRENKAALLKLLPNL